MNTDRNGGYAFPHAHEDYPFQHGMNLRDWFAGQLIGPVYASNLSNSAKDAALIAYQVADEMIKARSK